LKRTLKKSEKSQIEHKTKVNQSEKSCPPKSIKQIGQCLKEMSDCAKATKEQNSSSTEP